MKTTFRFFALWLILTIPAAARQQGVQNALLDHLAGKWVLKGTIAGSETTHDIDSEWILGHNYLRLHEISREVTEDGAPEYEAIVLIEWNETSNQFACLWLDSTGSGGLSTEVIGYAKRSGDKLPFMFKLPDGGIIHNTFVYNRDSDTWEWFIDNESDGKRQVFARVLLKRR